MSFNGIATFDKNLRALMASDAFKNANDAERLKLGGTLLRSGYGAMAVSAPKELRESQEVKHVNND